MEQLVRLKVGPSVNQDGAENEIRGSKDASLVIQDGHARYQEAVYRNNVYSACNQAAQAVTALGTAMTGFVLYNPIASGKNLVLWHVDVAPASTTVLATAAFIAICLAGAVGPNVAAPTSTTGLTIINNNLNGVAATVAKVFSTATFAGVTPTLFAPIAAFAGTTAISAESISVATYDIGGYYMVPPGAYVCIAQTPTAQGLLAFVASMTWEEIPI
jgi:hypothetical protein